MQEDFRQRNRFGALIFPSNGGQIRGRVLCAIPKTELGSGPYIRHQA